MIAQSINQSTLTEAQDGLNHSLLISIDLLDVASAIKCIDAGADVNCAASGAHVMPIISAINSGNLDMIRLLIDRGANIHTQFFLTKNKIDPLESSSVIALMAAVESVDIDVIKLIMEKGANINDQDSAGFTAAMLAALEEDAEILRYLLDNGADLDLVNIEGRNVIDIIKFHDLPEMMAVVEEYQLNQSAHLVLAVETPEVNGNPSQRIRL